MGLDKHLCWQALKARDARFDGRFFTCVSSTGVFCRPVCPARTPLLRNCRFVPSAAAALEAGFRPCLRCRPETSPGTPAWNGTSTLVTRALRLIDAGALDSGNVEQLSDKLGVGPRHLRRLFDRHLGAAPQSVAVARRLLLAKSLLSETALPVGHVAIASGFQSARRFREAFSKTYGRSPSACRGASGASPGIRLALGYRPPYDWHSLLTFLSKRAIPGIEQIDGTAYRRRFRLDPRRGDCHDFAPQRTQQLSTQPAGAKLADCPPTTQERMGAVEGAFEVSPSRSRPALDVSIECNDLRALPQVLARIRRMFDLTADPTAVERALSADSRLAELIRQRPGLRIPGVWDPFEAGARAILGQQVSIEAATRAAAKLAALCNSDDYFPTPAEVASANLTDLGGPASRRASLQALAAAFASGRIPADGDFESARLALEELPGIGPWTSHYVSMRALGDPDAFPASDLALRRAWGGSAQELAAAAEAWRPWRAYAAVHLWRSQS